MNTRPCNGCGAPIVWARLEGEPGKWIPLDPKPAVYRVIWQETGAYASRANGGEFTGMVSHFVTCPKASEFSRAKRGENG